MSNITCRSFRIGRWRRLGEKRELAFLYTFGLHVPAHATESEILVADLETDV